MTSYIKRKKLKVQIYNKLKQIKLKESKVYSSIFLVFWKTVLKNNRSCRLQMFYKISVLKSFVIITRKHL